MVLKNSLLSESFKAAFLSKAFQIMAKKIKPRSRL